MNLLSCENPQVIFNKYLKNLQVVDCNKCNTCRNKRQFDWVQRLTIERQCWRYCVFWTLTYNEDTVPWIEWSDTSDGEINSSLPCDVLQSVADILFSDSSSLEYFNRLDRLRVLDYRDLQKFIKRFRRNFDYGCKKSENYKSEETVLRYYAIGEYGETTCRPHYHGLFFFNSRWLKDNFEEVFTKSWSTYNRSERTSVPLGRTDWSFAERNSAFKYCAQYINCSYNIPKCLSNSKVRPKALFSKRPPIGSLLQLDSQIQKIWNDGLTEMSVWNPSLSRYEFQPISRTLESRLFPRLHRFSLLSDLVLYRLYKPFGFIPRKLLDVSEEVALRAIRLFHEKFVSESTLYEYCFNLTDGFTDNLPLIKYLRVCRRVEYQSIIFGCSVDYYVSRIVLYYDNRDRLSLRNWLRFEEDYSKLHPHIDLVTSDLILCNQLYFASSKVNGILRQAYDLVDSNITLHKLSYQSVPSYRDMVLLNSKISKDNTKTKKKNDYLLAHPEKALFSY